MTAVSLVLTLFLISGIACAWFAGPRFRSQAGWFVFGCLVGPLAILLLLLLPPLPETRRKSSWPRIIGGFVFAIVLIAVVAVGAAEFWERYQEGKRYAELDNWAVYGDALLRFIKTSEHASDALVVKSANEQIDNYYHQLRDGLCWTMYDLELAVQGLRRSYGTRALLSNARRLWDSQSIEWPATIPMAERDKDRRMMEWSKRIQQYESYLDAITAARADSTAAASR